tara:strand:- start:1024 stop:2520 length:1497 start_codon:yes stop_codon:yes gene_type:complete
MEFIPTILINNNVKNITIYGDFKNISTINNIQYIKTQNGFNIVINRDNNHFFGKVYIEVFYKLSDATDLVIKSGGRINKRQIRNTRKKRKKVKLSKIKNDYGIIRKNTRKNSRRNTRKNTRRNTHRRRNRRRNTRKMYNLKGGNGFNVFIKLICFYCFFLVITYTNTIVSDAPQMTTQQYINNFDVTELENAISNTTIEQATNIPVFGQCYDDGKCITDDLSKEHNKPPIFAAVDLISEKRNETNFGRYLDAFTKMPILTDSSRGFHKLVKVSYNSATKQLEIKGSRDLNRIEEGNQPPLPKSETFNELLYATIKDQINAFKERGMTDNSIKEYCVTTFIDQSKPKSYLEKTFFENLGIGWHQDSINSVKYDYNIGTEEERKRDGIANTFKERSQYGGPMELLFAITYDDLDYEDIIRTKVRMLQRGGGIQYIAPHFMGPKRSTLLLDQRVMSDKTDLGIRERLAALQHWTQLTTNPKPRTLTVVAAQEIKEGMTCLV